MERRDGWSEKSHISPCRNRKNFRLSTIHKVSNLDFPSFSWWNRNCCCCLVSKSYLTLWDPMHCSSSGSSVCGISKARILEWVTIPFSRGSSWTRDQAYISCLDRPALYHWATGEDLKQKLDIIKALNCPYLLSLASFLPFSYLQSCWSLLNSISNKLPD